MFKDLFKKTQYITVSSASGNNNRNNENNFEKKLEGPHVPDGMWIKCSKCNSGIYKKELDENLKVCPACGHHFRVSAVDRIDQIADSGTFQEINGDMASTNPISFPDYEKKLSENSSKSGLNEAVVTGKCKIDGHDVVICIMDSNFMMGSMGSVVGEKITRAIEMATEIKLPVIIFSASGGARMQEGMVSLMQMAKTSAAIKRHGDNGLLYITVLTDPTTGGVTASFAMLGDVIIAEKGALVGFAGKRVIEQTIKQKLPDTFQSAEFIWEHGFCDIIADRRELKNTLGKILSLHRRDENE